jgi:hypothetical protein
MSRPVDRHPRHQLRVHVVIGLGTRLPDAVVGLADGRDGDVDQMSNLAPQAQRGHPVRVLVQQRRVEQRSHDVVLALSRGGVADAHGRAAAVSAEVAEHLFAHHIAAVDRDHDVELAAGVDAVAHEVEEAERLGPVADQVHRPDRHRAVAGPREPVVPVAFAADPLGQARGRCRDHGPGRGVLEQLQRERGAQHVVSPRSVVVELRSPATPEAARSSKLLEGSIGRDRLGPVLPPGEDGPEALSRIQPDAGGDASLLARLQHGAAVHRQRQPLPTRALGKGAVGCG